MGPANQLFKVHIKKSHRYRSITMNPRKAKVKDVDKENVNKLKNLK